MKHLILVFGLAAVSLAGVTAQAPSIRATDVRGYVGRTVVVEDSVAEVRWEEQSAVTYLNFGAAFPQHVFRAIVPDDVRVQLPTALFSSPRVRVQGTVRLGPKAVPEIACTELSQLIALAALPAAAGLFAAPPAPAAAPKPCCRVCTTGKACGNTCISRNLTCRQPPGCACNG